METQCPYCKSSVSPEARKCPFCQEWIKEKPKSKAVYFLLAMFLPTGLVGAAEWYIGRKKTACFICLFNVFLSLLIISFSISMCELLLLLIVLFVELFIFSSGLHHIDKINGKSSSNR